MIVNEKISVPNSISAPSVASFSVKIKTAEELREISAFAGKAKLPLLALGEGTNILPHEFVKAVIVFIGIKGLGLKKNFLEIGAGEKWDNAVKFAVKNHLSGIEALSFIPGKAGAAAVQNIGAYGSEISDVLEKIEFYDIKKNKFLSLKNKDCQFEYRDSIFKKYPGRFFITSLTLKLSRKKPKIPRYKDLIDYFSKKKNQNPSLAEIRKAVIAVRKKKLPDYKILPNAGSYFTNPILNKKEAMKIKNKFPEIPFFPFGEKIKIPAGWLIERAGLKGVKVKKLEIYSKNALILTNPNRAGFKDIKRAEDFIRKKVYKKFSVILEREPSII